MSAAPAFLLLALFVLLGSLSDAPAQNSERTIRNVTPDNIPVIILPPRAEPQKDPRSRVEEPVSGDLYIASVAEDGTITVNGRALSLFGVRALPANILCEEEKGGRWACGLRAYVMLRNLIHAKEIRCEILRELQGIAVAKCFRERSSISLTLLADGWAFYDEAANDEVLAAAAKDAQKRGRGIWMNGSRPSQPIR